MGGNIDLEQNAIFGTFGGPAVERLHYSKNGLVPDGLVKFTNIGRAQRSMMNTAATPMNMASPAKVR